MAPGGTILPSFLPHPQYFSQKWQIWRLGPSSAVSKQLLRGIMILIFADTFLSLERESWASGPRKSPWVKWYLFNENLNTWAFVLLIPMDGLQNENSKFHFLHFPRRTPRPVAVLRKYDFVPFGVFSCPQMQDSGIFVRWESGDSEVGQLLKELWLSSPALLPRPLKRTVLNSCF